MTDARLAGYWLNELRFMDLSDRAWRVFTAALMWSAEQGTDGVIPMRYATRLHTEGVTEDDLNELVECGVLERADDAVRLLGWSDPSALRQSTAEQVDAYRERKRTNQAEYRRRRKEGGHVTGNVGEGVNSSRSSAYKSGHVTGNAAAVDCGPGNHKLVADGTCALCTHRGEQM